MKVCILSGKTQKGKNKISQHGDTWEILKENNNVLLLKSLNKTFRNEEKMEHDMRNVNSVDDPDFKINSRFEIEGENS